MPGSATLHGPALAGVGGSPCSFRGVRSSVVKPRGSAATSQVLMFAALYLRGCGHLPSVSVLAAGVPSPHALPEDSPRPVGTTPNFIFAGLTTGQR